jgi:hypothetical protein
MATRLTDSLAGFLPDSDVHSEIDRFLEGWCADPSPMIDSILPEDARDTLPDFDALHMDKDGSSVSRSGRTSPSQTEELGVPQMNFSPKRLPSPWDHVARLSLSSEFDKIRLDIEEQGDLGVFADPDVLLQALDRFASLWPWSDDDMSEMAALRATMRNFCIDARQLCVLDDRQLEASLQKYAQLLNSLEHLLCRHNLLSDDIEHRQRLQLVQNIRLAMSFGCELVKREKYRELQKQSSEFDQRSEKRALQNLLGLLSVQDISQSPKVKLVTRLLSVVTFQGLRRFQGGLWKEIVTPAGMRTHAYEMAYATMNEFVASACSRDRDRHLWELVFDTPLAFQQAVKYLREAQDSQLPNLVVNRNLFAFANGIMDTAAMNWYPYGGPDKLPSSQVCANYIPHKFHYNAAIKVDWRSCPTPCFDSILDAQLQQADPVVRQLVWAFCGRMQFAVHQCDRWAQVMQFIGGRDSGARTVVKASVACYRHEDTAQLSQSSTSLPKNWLAVTGTDITEQSRLTAIQNRSQQGHILLHGSEHTYSDPKHVLTVLFSNAQVETNPRLRDHVLGRELPALIWKMAAAYHELCRATNTVCTNPLSSILNSTDYFRMSAAVGPVNHTPIARMLRSSAYVCLRDDLGCPREAIIRAFTRFRDVHRLGHVMLWPGLLDEAARNLGCEVEHIESPRLYNGMYVDPQVWYFGMDVNQVVSE